MSLPMAVKRLVRPLVPNRIVARYRLRQHSQKARSNVEVFVTSKRQARRWRATTPDTYRVRVGPLPSAPVSRDVTVLAAESATEEDRAVAAGLAATGLGVGVVAVTARPKLKGGRRSEPALDPIVIVVLTGDLADVGGVPDGAHPLRGVLARVRDAGYPVAIHPRATVPMVPGRDDPIEREAWVVLAAVPMHDIGGGSRSAQLALELLRRGAHVTYVSLYASQETSDLGLRFVHPNLEQHLVTSFDSSLLVARSGRTGRVLVEAPAPELASPAWKLAGAGWSVVYDVIDDWRDPELGGDWYSPSIENELMTKAVLVTASAPDLQKRADPIAADTALIPNAVNEDIFGVHATTCPEELQPLPLPIIGYHGSLYGSWFDWEQVTGVAAAFPEAAVVLIGDDKGHPPLPANVFLLGMRPQRDLPAYLQHMDVGLVPFSVSETTHAVSPLKVFEYLASGVPVAAPPLRPLEGLVGVVADADLVSAVHRALQGTRPDRNDALARHSWRQRVDSLYRALGESPPSRTDAAAAVAIRPVEHHAREDRLITAEA